MDLSYPILNIVFYIMLIVYFSIAHNFNKTERVGLPGREITLHDILAIWIQYMNVTDRRTDRRTPHRPTANTAVTHRVAR